MENTNKKSNYKTLNDYFLELTKVDSLEKMEKLVDELVEAADQTYSCISCKTGCYTCCTGASMPVVYSKEWQRIRHFLKEQPKEKKNEIIERVKKFTNKHGHMLDFLRSVITQKCTAEELKENMGKLKTEFKDSICPFHIDGKCSIYEVRPMKCRSFGYFKFAFENQTFFLSCDSDTYKMQNYLAKQKTNQLALPYYNYFEKKLVEFALDDQEDFDMNIIPLWLKNDIEKNNL